MLVRVLVVVHGTTRLTVARPDKNIDDPGKFRSPYGKAFADAQLAVDFDTVPMSGSAQFGGHGLKVIADRIRALSENWFRVMVVDLRQGKRVARRRVVVISERPPA